jgi:hypothetical protein
MFGLGTPGIGSGKFTAGDHSLKQKESSRCLLPSPPEVPLLPSVISSGASTPSNLLTPGRLYEDDDGISMVSSFVSDRSSSVALRDDLISPSSDQTLSKRFFEPVKTRTRGNTSATDKSVTFSCSPVEAVITSLFVEEDAHPRKPSLSMDIPKKVGFDIDPDPTFHRSVGSPVNPVTEAFVEQIGTFHVANLRNDSLGNLPKMYSTTSEEPSPSTGENSDADFGTSVYLAASPGSLGSSPFETYPSSPKPDAPVDEEYQSAIYASQMLARALEREANGILPPDEPIPDLPVQQSERLLAKVTLRPTSTDAIPLRPGHLGEPFPARLDPTAEQDARGSGSATAFPPLVEMHDTDTARGSRLPIPPRRDSNPDCVLPTSATETTAVCATNVYPEEPIFSVPPDTSTTGLGKSLNKPFESSAGAEGRYVLGQAEEGWRGLRRRGSVAASIRSVHEILWKASSVNSTARSTPAVSRRSSAWAIGRRNLGFRMDPFGAGIQRA